MVVTSWVRKVLISNPSLGSMAFSAIFVAWSAAAWPEGGSFLSSSGATLGVGSPASSFASSSFSRSSAAGVGSIRFSMTMRSSTTAASCESPCASASSCSIVARSRSGRARAYSSLMKSW